MTGSINIFLDFLYAKFRNSTSRLRFVANLGLAISWTLIIGSLFSGTEKKASENNCVLRTFYMLILENRPLKMPVK